MRCGSGSKSSRLAVGGLPVRSHPGRVEVSLSETPNPRLLLTSWLVPCMAANRRWCVSVSMNGWMRGTVLWIKALYKCSPFTIKASTPAKKQLNVLKLREQSQEEPGARDRERQGRSSEAAGDHRSARDGERPTKSTKPTLPWRRYARERHSCDWWAKEQSRCGTGGYPAVLIRSHQNLIRIVLPVQTWLQ